MAKANQTQTISISEIEALIQKAEQSQLSTEDAPIVIRVSKLVLTLLSVIDDKKMSIAHLKRMIFGSKSEKRRPTSSTTSSDNKLASQPNTENSTESNLTSTTPEGNEANLAPVAPTAKKRPGHGRLAKEDFPGAQTIICLHSELKHKDKCPHKHCSGHVYDTKEPQILIKREARPIIDAIKYEKQVLRCSGCGERFAANLPNGVSEEKYDVTADVMLAIVKYHGSLPWYRLQRLQEIMGVPLPASIQFWRCETVANAANPIYLEIQRQAAQLGLLHVDDTGVKILSLLKENETLAKGERKGMHTTGVGGRSADFDIVLYFSGRNYSGENLQQLLKKRAYDLTEPLLMGDAESKNWVGDYVGVLLNCLAHGRRKFADCEPIFPDECRYVLDALGQVYFNDAQTKQMTPSERLAYHQKHSQPIMEALNTWLEEQISSHKPEPISSLGKAMKYLLNHWDRLTGFLSLAGAPLDNNFVERSLRRIVLLRKNSLFFKNEHGAAIGDVLLSVIETCVINNINPFDYLVAIMRNKQAVRAHPELWLPWNYQLQKLKAA